MPNNLFAIPFRTEGRFPQAIGVSAEDRLCLSRCWENSLPPCARAGGNPARVCDTMSV